MALKCHGKSLFSLNMMVVFLLFASLEFRAADVINVLEYGAKGDGDTDDSQSFLNAWRAACNGSDDATVLVPAESSYMLTPTKFQGPCNSSSITFQIDGEIVTSWNIDAWLKNDTAEGWLVFRNIKGLTITGNGSINGQGADWWPIADKVDKRPKAFEIYECEDLVLSGLTYVNSPSSHIYTRDCNNLTFSNLQIFAPEDSPNTDGIDVGRSTNLLIFDCTIRTGDDCIAINGGSSNINISDIACGPGHGISIGSLGAQGEHDTVEQVHVQHCNLTNTTNGARIKTLQGGSGYARDITFEDITLDSVKNPIIIDQYYCNDRHDCTDDASAVEVSNVTYRGIWGTSKDENALMLKCSQTVACTNLLFDNINITSINSRENTLSSCTNAHGRSLDSFPPIDCLLF